MRKALTPVVIGATLALGLAGAAWAQGSGASGPTGAADSAMPGKNDGSTGPTSGPGTTGQGVATPPQSGTGSGTQSNPGLGPDPNRPLPPMPGQSERERR
jgi:hypothetical protein